VPVAGRQHRDPGIPSSIDHTKRSTYASQFDESLSTLLNQGELLLTASIARRVSKPAGVHQSRC
jgi:hypothetical protein